MSLAAQGLQQLNAVHGGQAQVQNHGIERFVLQCDQGRVTIGQMIDRVMLGL